MEQQKEAPQEGGANYLEHSQDSAPRRLPRADELKQAIDPAAFYAAELPDAPPLKRRNGAWSQNILCPFHDEDTGSFGVNLDTGAARCFGCEFYAGGVIDFTMARHGLDFDQAREKLAKDWSLDHGTPPRRDARTPPGRRPPARQPAPQAKPASGPAPMMPIPQEALATRPQAHPTRGKPSAEWTYRDPTGTPLLFVCRFDPPGKRKEFVPLTYWANGWDWKGPPAPKPLYGLDRLAARPDASVLVAEGEKSADAAAELLPGLVAVTTFGGATNPKYCDFGPLRGRRVFIWPDADEAGATYARAVAELAHAAGAESVSVLDLASLAGGPPHD